MGTQENLRWSLSISLLVLFRIVANSVELSSVRV